MDFPTKKIWMDSGDTAKGKVVEIEEIKAPAPAIILVTPRPMVKSVPTTPRPYPTRLPSSRTVTPRYEIKEAKFSCSDEH